MLKNNIADADQRTRALNPRESFIVQAPAGSGKTELLTQRFLLLLGTVRYPEEILAMTFTRKAAAEMRARIIHALKKAQHESKPELSHAQKTWELASIVLEQDKKYGWSLLSCPNRLRIQTIDSFNYYLTKQLPILSHFGASPDLTDDADSLYRLAIQEILSHLEENVAWSDAIAILLLHRDNDLEKVTDLFIHLLARRDQWISDITQNSTHSNLRKFLEQHLLTINNDILSKLNETFPKQHSDELLNLAQFAANQLEIKKIPNDRQNWLTLAELLLTKNNEWRKRFDKNSGFPADKIFAPMKQRMNELMQQFIQYDEFRNALIELRHAPNTTYSDQQWQTLSALHDILRIAVAQLQIIFMEQGKVDYTENALAALKALGTEDQPTDLTLALDSQIRHILVDEFQDTSNTQYQLLKKLTAGWEPNDGRTLFLVGDPMQSIYLFREAEVGLFIRTRLRGLGHLTLQPLILSVNFRSTSRIVEWVNDHFHRIFPLKDDITTSSVSYSHCKALPREHHDDESRVELISHHANSTDWQGRKMVNVIQDHQQKYPNDTIAILVRSRSHLKDIIPALRHAGLSYRAIDIDPLTERPVIQDLLVLTRALLNPCDRIAWLAILRAPWCGFLLSDLLKISVNTQNTIWQQLQSIDIIQSLSTDGQIRLKRILPILSNSFLSRCRLTLVDLIEHTWRHLGGPATLSHKNDLEDAATYFQLLKQFSNSDFIDADLLEKAIKKLYAAPQQDANEKLQIMTIHNSKGLEFDAVILPHLEKQTINNDRGLLAWMERTNHENSSAFIMAPIEATGASPDSVYEYIRRQNELRMEHEKSRLLYVAVTRAKKHLFLLFDPPNNEKPPSSSLLSKLWPAIYNTMIVPERLTDLVQTEKVQSHSIYRLKLEWINPLKEIHTRHPNAAHQTVSGFMLPDQIALTTGTIIHRIIQQLCLQGEKWWLDKQDETKKIWLKNILSHLAVPRDNHPSIIQIIYQSIHHLLSDPKGRWIIQPHTDAQSEYRIGTIINNKPQQLIIDRTFIDEKGTRWIIDYKTSHTSSHSIDSFIENETKKYEKQLQQYGEAMRNLSQHPIRLGLYFPSLKALREWAFQ